MSTSGTRLEPGVVLADRYQLQRRLGSGAMGLVVLAWDRVLERQVAIKELLPHLVGDRAIAERAMREAQLLARLNNPAIVVVHDRLTTPEGGVYLVLEYVNGPSLDRVLAEQGRLPWPRCAEIGIAVCDALETAHAKDIIHRDIKPGNILIDARGRVKVADFGIARLTGSGGASLGTQIGTPAYMAPEQTRGKAVESSDLYSLCCVLFEAACGRRPFVGEDGTPIAMLHIMSPVPDPFDVAPDLPRAARDLIVAGLAKEPADRPASAAALAAELRRSLRTAPAPQDTVAHPPPTEPAATEPAATEPVTPVGDTLALETEASPAPPSAPSPAPRPAPQPRSRRRALAAAAVVAALVAGAVGGALAAPSDEDPPPPPAVVETGTVPAGPLALTAPADWTSASGQPTGTDDLPLDGAVTLKPPGATPGTAVVAGMSAATGPRLVPASVEAGEAERVRLGALAALRYPAARLGDAPATLHVVPTSDGVATVACLGDAAGGDGDLGATCDAMAASLRLRGATAFGLDPDPRYAAALGRSLDRVDAALARLAGADGETTAAAQGARARSAARAVAAARRDLPAAATLSPAVRPAHAALVAALAAEASALSRMAAAADAGKAGGWAAGRRAATAARQRLGEALEQLDAAGYRTVAGS